MHDQCRTIAFSYRRRTEAIRRFFQPSRSRPGSRVPNQSAIRSARGTVLGVSKIPQRQPVDSAGNLRLGPSIRKLGQPMIKYVFALAVDIMANLEHGFIVTYILQGLQARTHYAGEPGRLTIRAGPASRARPHSEENGERSCRRCIRGNPCGETCS